MNTVIIDRSLAEMKFLPEAGAGRILLYLCALRESGVTFFELNRQAAERAGIRAYRRAKFENNTDEMRLLNAYIFRAESLDDIEFARDIDFRYVILPLRLLYLAGRIPNPVILEVALNNADASGIFEALAENIDFSSLAMLRLTGDFRSLTETDTLGAVIERYRRRYSLPLDISPTNESMTALAAAVSAYTARTDSVSLCFGSNLNSASLEDFLITLTTIYGLFPERTYLNGLSRAAKLAKEIGDANPDNMNLLAESSKKGNLFFCPAADTAQLRNVAGINTDFSVNIKKYCVKGMSTDPEDLSGMSELIDGIIKKMKV